ncbi:MAG: type I restriction enzyme HsdR N-terminal domain-containing protein [Bacteroidota bacterium]
MMQLNLPNYAFKIITDGERKQIFDEIRRKYVALTPEEWVRQNFVQYLIHEKQFPKGLIAIESVINYAPEHKVMFAGKKRGDIVAYDRSGNPLLITECKSPDIKITQDAFDQAARYNMALKVKYLVVTNGLIHYCCLMDYVKKSYEFLEEIPEYDATLSGNVIKLRT